MLQLIPENYKQFLATDDGQPFVMLNLLRFQPDSGLERYQEYASLVEPLLKNHGARLIWSGAGLAALSAEPGQDWDAVALVRYPSRRAFANLISDPEYAPAAAIREKALLEAVLQPLVSKDVGEI